MIKINSIKNREQRTEQKANRRLSDQVIGRLSDGKMGRLSDEKTSRWRDMGTERLGDRVKGLTLHLNIYELWKASPMSIGINNELQTTNKKPLQATLHGSRYKSALCLPQERFNSGVVPAAAAITRKRSTNSSPRATWSSEAFHLKYITRSEELGSQASTGHKVMEELPMK